MRVVHSYVKTMEIPLERLAFEPDPLELNGPVECTCFMCWMARQREQLEQPGVPLTVGGFPLLDLPAQAPVSEAEAEPRELAGPTAEEVAQHTPAAAFNGPPAAASNVTAFDVHGDLEARCQPAEAEEFPGVPPALVRAVEAAGMIFGRLAAWFYLLFLAPAVPKARVVSGE